MAISPGLPQISTAPRPDWLSRNWKWVVPVGFLSLVVLIVGFVGCLFLIIETSFQHSDCYKHAMARARSSPQVTEKIGEPLVPGWLGSGNINVSGSSGNAEMSIPISGPRGKGSIYLLAKKSAGEWSFQRLEVEVEGEDPRIDLLKPQENTPGEH